MPTKEPRSSNFELLRIVAMLMIVLFHCVLKSDLINVTTGFNRIQVSVLSMLGEIGVDLFVLITGYFLINGTFRWRKILLMTLQVMFYCWFSYGVQCLVAPEPINWRIVMEMIFPIIYGRYWFATTYVLLYLFSPFLNKLAASLTQKEYKRLLGLALLVWSVLPTFFGAIYDETENLMQYNRLIWLAVVYLAGGYLRLYPRVKIREKKHGLWLAAASFAALVLSVLVIEAFPEFFKRIGIKWSCYLWRPNTVPILCCAVGLFLAFSHIRVRRGGRVINRVASATFGVYLLHDGMLLSWLWGTAFPAARYAASPWLTPFLLYATAAVFAAGCAVELGRQWLERKLVLPLLARGKGREF